MFLGSSPVAAKETSDTAPVSGKVILDIQATNGVCIYSETRTSHDKNIESNASCR